MFSFQFIFEVKRWIDLESSERQIEKILKGVNRMSYMMMMMNDVVHSIFLSAVDFSATIESSTEYTKLLSVGYSHVDWSLMSEVWRV